MSSKIGIYEFNLMPMDEQSRTVWEFSEFVANHIEGDLRHQLRSINDFFVEVVYHNSENKIIEFKTFKKGHRLTKYLDQIDIQELM